MCWSFYPFTINPCITITNSYLSGAQEHISVTSYTNASYLSKCIFIISWVSLFCLQALCQKPLSKNLSHITNGWMEFYLINEFLRKNFCDRGNSVFCRCMSFPCSYMLTRKLNEDTANVFSCSIYSCNWSYCKAVLKYIAKAGRVAL